jgi:uncharacterized membrane protein
MRIESGPIKTTILGGVVFLVPLVILIAIFGKVFVFMSKIAEPISSILPVDSIAGIAVVELVTVMATLLLCFLAGLAAKSAFGARISEAVESKLLTFFPRYAFVKTMTESIGNSQESTLKPVMARFDDLSQVAFEVERHEDDSVTVYLPGCPDPWSGSLVNMTKDRIEPLDTDFVTLVKRLRTVGKSSHD